MTEPCIVAVDPGLTGAVAFFFPSAPERVSVEDMPVVAGEVDAAALARRIRQMGPTLAVVERVAARPTDSRVGAFNFGGSYMAARVVIGLCEVPMHLVTPQTWKKHHRLLGTDKEASRALALRLFPASADRFARKKDDGRAEAALIARYAADKLLSLPMAATRSGCAGDGEGAAAPSPELTT